jgi:hypothetical protein
MSHETGCAAAGRMIRRLFSRLVEITNKNGVNAEFFWHMNCGKKFHG